MRHGKKFNHLGRKSGHRKALIRNLALALIEHKRINTTLAKAKALRQFIEPLITKSKNSTTHNMRVVFSYLQNKEAVKELFGPIAAKVGERPGGYVRIIKTGFRQGDSAEMAMIELVDYNEVYNPNAQEESKSSGRRRRRRGGSGAAKQHVEAQTEAVVEDVVEEEASDEAVVVEEEEIIDESSEKETKEATENEEENKDSSEEKS